jgi:hypothetical protein
MEWQAPPPALGASRHAKPEGIKSQHVDMEFCPRRAKNYQLVGTPSKALHQGARGSQHNRVCQVKGPKKISFSLDFFSF